MGKMNKRTMYTDNLLAMMENTNSYRIWFNRIAEIFMSRFQWDNLPDEIPERFIEQSLMRQGACWLGVDKLGGMALASRMNNRARPNFYGDPVEFECYGLNGVHFTAYRYDGEGRNFVGVPIWNNYQRTPSYLTIREYALRLALIERTIDVNVNGQKTPRIIAGTQEQILSFKNAVKDIDTFSAALVVDKSLDVNESLQVFAQPAPYVADKLKLLSRDQWAEVLDMGGVGQPPEKRERLNEREIETSIMSAQATLYSGLTCRQEAAKLFNDMFDYNVQVSYRDFGLVDDTTEDNRPTDREDNKAQEVEHA